MLQAMNTGHDGSLTTLHAGSADEAVLRLVLMARFGMDLPTAVIEEQVATAIDVIVMARRMADGSRVIADLSAVHRGEDGGVELEPLVAFDAQERSWQLVQEPAWVQQALAAGACSPEEVRTWRAQCCS
jgi:pilus assembly protein CpaF